MIPTETLIATICAEAEAELSADPQATIRRLKQDLRAARQAATKARNYAERVRDGIVTPEIEQMIAEREDAATQALLMERNAALAKIAELNAVIARRDETIRSGRAAFARATRRVVNAENERDAAWRENDALRASKSHTADSEPEPPSLVYLLGRYPEIRRTYELVESLYAAPDGQYAAVANRMLAMIDQICRAVEPKAGKGNRAA